MHALLKSKTTKQRTEYNVLLEVKRCQRRKTTKKEGMVKEAHTRNGGGRFTIGAKRKCRQKQLRRNSVALRKVNEEKIRIQWRV